MTSKQKTYRNSSTGAVRISSRPMGYPFVEVADAPKSADKGADTSADKGTGTTKKTG